MFPLSEQSTQVCLRGPAAPAPLHRGTFQSVPISLKNFLQTTKLADKDIKLHYYMSLRPTGLPN